jgi:hypothetical protein
LSGHALIFLQSAANCDQYQYFDAWMFVRFLYIYGLEICTMC